MAILIGMLLLLGKFYKQDRRRTEYNNCQRRVTSQEASSYAEGDDETKRIIAWECFLIKLFYAQIWRREIRMLSIKQKTD